MQQPLNKVIYDQCEDRIIDIYQLVASRNPYVPEEVDNFAN